MNRGGELLFSFSLAAGKLVEEGIMLDILLRLPVKSLIRFKCVCKSWRDLISDPSFATAHLSRCMLGNPNSQRLLLAMERPDDSESGLKFLCYENTTSEAVEVENDLLECPLKFKLPKPYTLYAIVGSFHGLVCLQIWDQSNTPRTLISVWNPTTGAFEEIPLHPYVTDNNTRFYVVGFGYDSASDDYKLLAYVFVSETKGWELVIFAMKEKYWRSVSIHHVEKPPLETAVHVNGFLYWLKLCYNNSPHEPSCSILSFDLSNEKFEMIPPPADIDYTCLFFQLVEFRGCLLFYTGEDEYRCKKCWIMEGHGSWTKVCDITCQSGDSKMTGRVMCCKTDWKVLLGPFRGQNSIEYLFCLYSPEKNQFTPFAPLKNPMLHSAKLYVESLVSP